MTTLVSMASLALAGAAMATPTNMRVARQDVDNNNILRASNLTLAPIQIPTVAVSEFAPQTDVVLPYGLNTANFINITLTMPSAVLLETIESLSSVDCSDTAAVMSFDSTEDLNAAYAEWSKYESLILVTNHLGDCDTEVERGFFVASAFTVSDSTLIAEVAKSDAPSVSSYMRANFTGIPAQENVHTLIELDPAAVGISALWELPAEQVLFELPPYVRATANSGSVGLGLTLDGYLDFDILTFSLDALYVDATAHASIALELELNVAAPYSGNFTYGDAIAYYIIDVPGLLTLGPELAFAVGAEVNVDAEVSVVLGVGAEIANGTVHLDMVGPDTVAAGWEPTYYANLSFTQEAAVAVAPFAEISVGLEFSILGGVLDLSSGITPRVEFPTSATLSAGQEAGTGGGAVTGDPTVTPVGADGTCANGVEVVSDFKFLLNAFVTQFWGAELYSVTVPVANECYSWD